MIIKIVTISLMAVFYICYFAKLISQKKQGIKTDQLGKGKEGFVKFIEVALKIITYLLPVIQIISDTYLYSTLQELVGAMVAVLFLVRTDRAGLLRRRGSGFFNGLLVGMYPLVFIGYNAFGSLVLGRPENGVLQPAARICTFLVSMAMVGVAEEFIFRGVIAQTLLEHFGTSRAGVWKACLLSGVLFGAAHLTNILSSAPFGVLMQCVFAASLGTLFAAIYFRTGNLWVTVFLHGAMDISSMLIGGLYGTTTVADAVSGYDASMLLSVLLYLIPTAVLLRKKKLPEVQLYWHQYVKK